MKNINSFVVEHKKAVFSTFIAVLIVVCGCVYAVSVSSQENVAVKEAEVEHPVKTGLSKEVDMYLVGVKNPDEATYKDEKVDINKLGDYDLVITYKDVDYTIKIKVVDKEKPVITLEKETFAFPLNSNVEEVNKSINKELKIKDNYDEEFDLIEVIKEIPESEKEVEATFSVKDSSNNESEQIKITIQFTEDGTEKEGLEKEESKVETKANTKAPAASNKNNSNGSTSSNSSASNNASGSNNSTSGSNSGGTSNNNNSGSSSDGASGGNSNTNETPAPTTKPEPTPAPTPDPEPAPTPQPNPTPTPDPEPTYVCPNGVIDKMKPCDYYEIPNYGYDKASQLFNTESEATKWSNNSQNVPDGSTVGVHEVTINDGNVKYWVGIDLP